MLGETPNLAARLQGIAAPGTVVIAQSTQRLIADLFELVDLGQCGLKGIGTPTRIWHVAGERTSESRFEAVHGRALTPLIGRNQELALLLDRWRMAEGGEGQVVLLSGEAGVGKSRLVAALQDALADESNVRLRYQCSPHHTNSALYPVINHLAFAADFGPDDDPDRRLDKLERLLAPSIETSEDVIPLFAHLLSLPLNNRYPPLKLSPESQKEKTLRALVDQLAALATRRPVLMVFEDAHWIDPTTRELIDLTIGRSDDLAVLIVITHRPEFQWSYGAHANVTTLSLNRLGRRDRLAMVDQLTVGKRLPKEVEQEIVAKTDGVPLFIEELTKTVLESGLLADEGDHYALTEPLPPLAIPVTLQDSLMARLDRLASVKDVAQIGAAIGREFSHDLLAAVARQGDTELGEALDKIVAAGLLFRRETPPHVTYTFKHALVQDAAYESMLHSRRRELHARIAQALRERFPEQAAMSPELLAHHYTEAELTEEAVDQWLIAGRRAAERSAGQEAIAHLSKGLHVLRSLPAGETKDASELALLIALGPLLRATRGYADESLKRTYARARELCLALDETDQLFPILVGLSFCFLVQGRYRSAIEQGNQCLTLAREQGHRDGAIGAHRAIGSACYWLGDFHSAEEHLREVGSLYDPTRHEEHVALYGYDPQVTCLGYLASTLWSLGFPEQALRACHESLDLAREHDHPYSVAMALTWAAWTHLHVGAARQVMVLADELKQVSIEQGYPHWEAFADVERGWAMVHGEGDAEIGVGLMRDGAESWHRVQGLLAYPWLVTNLADGYLRVSRPGPGLQAVRDALALIDASDGQHVESELIRLQGELGLLAPSIDEAEAEALFGRALDVARRQRARSWELRAATSLARLWRRQGKHGEARELLGPVLDWFTEGHDTPDLREGRALLDGRGR